MSLLPLVAALFALAGCVQATIELPPKEERATVIEKLPLAIGAFYGQRLRNYTYRQCLATGGPPPCPFAGFPIEVELGEASVTLFDRTLRELFETVRTVNVREPSALGSQMLAAIVEPEMVNFVLNYGRSRRWHATITYRLVLHSTRGDEMGQWTISGQASAGPGLAPTSVRSATHGALRAVEAQALVGFYEQPDVKRWLRSRGIVAPGSGRNER